MAGNRPLLTLLVLATVLAGTAPATASSHLPSCASVTDGDAVTVDGAVHLDAHNGAVEAWAEDNDVSGLQKSACVDAAGDAHGADAHVATASEDAVGDAVDEALALVPPLDQCVWVAGRMLCIM